MAMAGIPSEAVSVLHCIWSELKNRTTIPSPARLILRRVCPINDILDPAPERSLYITGAVLGLNSRMSVSKAVNALVGNIPLP